jgi:hypothetical protein
MKSNQSIEQTIELVNNSPSTIFHKDDVLRIISGIEVTEDATMTLEQIEDIASAIANRIYQNSDRICELESVTVSVGGYGNGIDDSTINVCEDRIYEYAVEVLQDCITPAEEVSTGTENNPADNQQVSN